MDKREIAEIMEHVISSIQKAGQVPEDQIDAYLLTGNEAYITKKDSARGYIKLLDHQEIADYIIEYRKQKRKYNHEDINCRR